MKGLWADVGLLPKPLSVNSPYRPLSPRTDPRQQGQRRQTGSLTGKMSCCHQGALRRHVNNIQRSLQDDNPNPPHDSFKGPNMSTILMKRWVHMVLRGSPTGTRPGHRPVAWIRLSCPHGGPSVDTTHMQAELHHTSTTTHMQPELHHTSTSTHMQAELHHTSSSTHMQAELHHTSTTPPPAA
ncbi:unnamed protein product [Boreogadus saida]